MDEPLRGGAGGIAGLLALVNEYGEALDADLRRYYHADLSDFLHRRITVRRMLSWVRNLPRDSALARTQDPDVEWGLAEQLLAAAVDVAMWANYQRAGGKGPKPKPIQRPGVGDAGHRYGKTDLPPDQVMAILEGYSRGDYEGGDDGD